MITRGHGPTRVTTQTRPARSSSKSHQTLRKYIAEGRLPAVKIGSRVKVLRTDLDALAVPKRASSFTDIEAAAERLAASAPPLTDAQVRRLAAIFGGGA